MKITDYPVITKFTEDNIMLVDGNSGTKTIKIADAILAALHLASITNHRLVVRGKNLGSVVTTEQLAAIQAGTFEDLWLGDYWVINGVNWRIVDFNYWLNSGDTKCTKNHLVIMPDKPLCDAAMNTATNNTAGGYIGSEMYTKNLQPAKDAIVAAFGDAVITHRSIFCNAVTSGKPSSCAWCDSQADLPSEVMMYGHRMFGARPDSGASDETIDMVQLALFQANPLFINPQTTAMWLRDVVSSNHFACTYGNGVATSSQAATVIGVRPVFAIG